MAGHVRHTFRLEAEGTGSAAGCGRWGKLLSMGGRLTLSRGGRGVAWWMGKPTKGATGELSTRQTVVRWEMGGNGEPRLGVAQSLLGADELLDDEVQDLEVVLDPYDLLQRGVDLCTQPVAGTRRHMFQSTNHSIRSSRRVQTIQQGNGSERATLEGTSPPPTNTRVTSLSPLTDLGARHGGLSDVDPAEALEEVEDRLLWPQAPGGRPREVVGVVRGWRGSLGLGTSYKKATALDRLGTPFKNDDNLSSTVVTGKGLWVVGGACAGPGGSRSVPRPAC